MRSPGTAAGWMCALLLAAQPAAAERVVWKPVLGALLKLDAQPAKHWNVYVARKRERLVLVQLGGRFLLLDCGRREASEVDAAALARQGKELHYRRSAEDAPKPSEAGSAETLLASEGWVVRNAGRARIVRVRLTREGRVLEVQLPLRSDGRLAY